MEELIKKMGQSGFSYFGIRSENRDLQEGYELEPSHDWEDGEMQDELLNGSCATQVGYMWFDGDSQDIETVQKAIDINDRFGYGKYMYIIGGNNYEDGNDDKEIVIENAVVVSRIK